MTRASRPDDLRDPAEQSLFLRLCYRDWRPTRLGRLVNRLQGWWSSTGLPPRFQVTLEVRGRTTGTPRSTPVVVVAVNGIEHVVSMLGPRSEWVKNVEAAGGDAVLRHGARRHVRLVRVDAAFERAPVLKEYARVAISGRKHIPVDRHAPLSDFAAVAGRYPVYRVESLARTSGPA